MATHLLGSHPMRTPSTIFILCALATGATAEPLVRFGMTSGADRNAPEGGHVGPLAGVGVRADRFTAETNYAYLSFMDPDTSIHRAGVLLRMDLVYFNARQRSGLLHASTTRALYTELGVAKRWGEWKVNQALDVSANEQREAHVGVGYQYGPWQLALRFGVSRRHEMLDNNIACRGVGCAVTMMPASTGLAESVMAEWMWAYDKF